MPDPLRADEDNSVTARFARWPVSRGILRDRLPLDIEERVVAYDLVRGIVHDADFILLSFGVTSTG